MRNAFAWVRHLLLQDNLDRRKVTFLWWEDTERLIRGDVHTPPRFSSRIPLHVYMFYYMLLIRPRWRRLELPIPPTYNWNNPRYNRPGYRIRVRNVVPWIILLSTDDRKNELKWPLYWPWRIRARNKRDPNVVTPTWSRAELFIPLLPPVSLVLSALTPSLHPWHGRLIIVRWSYSAIRQVCKDKASLTSFHDIGGFFYFVANFSWEKVVLKMVFHEFKHPSSR